MGSQGMLGSLPPAEFWVWGGVTLFFAAAIGFTTGYWYAHSAEKRAWRQAQTQLAKLFQAVVAALDKAEDGFRLLERFPSLALTPDQTEQLDRRRTFLQETIARIVERQRAAWRFPPQRQDRTSLSDAPAATWLRAPTDSRTELPNRTAFEANLAILLDRGRRAQIESGLLLIQMDRYEHLAARYGVPGADELLRKMARLVVGAVRGEEMACQYGTDALAVLMPGVDRETGHKLADAIRSTIRHHKFRLDESGVEVLVTASFGLTCCLPHDNADLVLSRAGDALAKSQRRGRNQLHVHDGAQSAHCLSG